jgi:hypothetical protein
MICFSLLVTIFAFGFTVTCSNSIGNGLNPINLHNQCNSFVNRENKKAGGGGFMYNIQAYISRKPVDFLLDDEDDADVAATATAKTKVNSVTSKIAKVLSISQALKNRTIENMLMSSQQQAVFGKGADVDMKKYLAAVDPHASRCAYLQIQHVERAGLGHTFACFGKYLKDAVKNMLTLHVRNASPCLPCHGSPYVVAVLSSYN